LGVPLLFEKEEFEVVIMIGRSADRRDAWVGLSS